MLTSLRGKFIFIFVLLTVSVVIVSSGFARYQQKQFALDRAKERAELDLQILESDIHSVFSWIKRDLLMLRNLPDLHILLNSHDPAQRLRALHSLQSSFLSLATYHQIFQQIRYIDEHGQEIIRVNVRDKHIWLTPPHLLQNKSGRYYFKHTILLHPDQIYISPMDLNIEQGKIERPLTPVIRYATPVQDDQGKIRGILILNVMGDTFLSLLKNQQGKVRPGITYFLLNRDGYYLFHRNSAKTFGFMLGHQDNFFQEEPDLQHLLETRERGAIFKKGASSYRQTLFAFRRINLFSPASSAPAEYWILLKAIDNRELLVGMNEYIQAFVPFTLLLVILCIGMAIFVAWSFSRPVLSLAEAASRIHQGDLSARARIYSRDDMGKLGHLFNEMAAQLEQTIRRLQLSEAKYRQIFENSRDCIFVTDTKCRIIDLNKAGKQLLGIDDLDSAGELSLNCCQTGDPAQQNPIIQRDIQEKGYVKDYETILQRPDGGIRHCILTATSRFDAQGQLIGYEGIIRDITRERERQKTEKEFQKKLQEEIILAEERERRHIGQVLHEELAQNLALVNLTLQEMASAGDTPSGGKAKDTKEQISLCRTLVKKMIEQIRTMIFDLYPVILDDQGLVPAMVWYGNNFSRRTGIEVQVYGVSGSLGLSDSQKIYLFRSFKELLNNAWKHARTREVVVTVKKNGHHVRLTVDDSGRGFQPRPETYSSKELQGIGLASIRQWVLAINGSMSIESEPGKGARISIDIPINQHLPDTAS